MPNPKGEIPIPRRLSSRGDFIDPIGESFKNSQNPRNGVRLMARIGDLPTANRVRKSGDEAEEGGAGFGIDETFGVGGGGDAFGGGFEAEGRRESWGGFGLGDGGEDDGLLGARGYVG